MSDPAPYWRSGQAPPSDGGSTVDVDLPRRLGRDRTDGGDPSRTVSFEKSPFVSLASLMAAVRRRWRLCGFMALAAVAVAVALSLAYPPPYSATTILLLRHPSSGNPTRAMANDMELIKTRTVAEDVVDRLDLDLDPSELVSNYEATALSDNLMRINVKGQSPDEAVRRADAVADSFLDFRSSEFERQSQVMVEALEEREKEITTELDTIVSEINNSSADAAAGSNADIRGFGELLARRAGLTQDLEQLRRRIDDGAIETESVIRQSRIVDVASEDERSPLRLLVANVAAGMVGGMGLGIGLVVVQAATSDRVRWRGDVSTALGAPVAVSVGPLRGPLWRQRRRFRRQLSRPLGEVSRIVRHLRNSLSSGDSGKRALTLVSVNSDGAAALLVASLAAEMLKAKKKVLVVDMSGNSILARFFRMRGPETSEVPVKGLDSTLWLTFHSLEPGNPLEEGQLQSALEFRRKADVVLTLVTVDPALGGWHLTEGAGPAVALVTAGRSSPTALRSAADMALAAGLQLGSTVLVGADPNDDTVGTRRGFAASADMPSHR